MASSEGIHEPQRGQGLASILATATANPANCIHQADYPDFYFRVTNSEHMTELKEKFKRMCDKSTIKKRYTYLIEEILKENPSICTYNAPSLDARQDILVAEVPKLGKEAASKAIKEWGQPVSKITHLIFCSVSGVDMPGADNQLMKLLALKPSVKRVMLYAQGCSAGAMVLRIAKDFAENNTDSQVLVVCSEITVDRRNHTDNSSNSEDAIKGHFREVGLTVHLSKDLSSLITDNIEKCLAEAFDLIGIGNDWNSLFWMAHPIGSAVLDQIEEKLGVQKERLRATRHVLSEYGNMASATVLFVIDEMRKKSKEGGKTTTGEGLEWGVLFGFGAGLTIDTVVLRSIPVISN
ncbi:hypothetical protein Dsin_002572 [Dipteronia sinensis]|uniref:Chalcone synthase n=1 Tax=Dipteronia sinensis TaxID=43782 RepID=A0AAE0EJJ2_9ROSI|nr:hypothetical protein Dsin_002572 [Dipteronia sinensis]